MSWTFLVTQSHTFTGMPIKDYINTLIAAMTYRMGRKTQFVGLSVFMSINLCFPLCTYRQPAKKSLLTNQNRGLSVGERFVLQLPSLSSSTVKEHSCTTTAPTSSHCNLLYLISCNESIQWRVFTDTS